MTSLKELMLKGKTSNGVLQVKKTTNNIENQATNSKESQKSIKGFRFKTNTKTNTGITTPNIQGEKPSIQSNASRQENIQQNVKTTILQISPKNSPLQAMVKTLSPSDSLKASLKNSNSPAPKMENIQNGTSGIRHATANENVEVLSHEMECTILNPTLSDIEKYVFDEQPENSTLEITEKFSLMLDELSLSMGNEIPNSLSRCLNFIKEHAFLAEILKPESLSILVASMRSSYGYVVKTQTAKSEKSIKRKAKTESVANDLANIKFF